MANNHQERDTVEQPEPQQVEAKKGKVIHLPGLKLIISAGLITVVTGVVASFGYLDGAMDFLAKFGLKPPQFSGTGFFPDSSETSSPKLTSTSWIGVKVEAVYVQQLPNYVPQTTLIRTDRNSVESIVVRNVDQDLSAIGKGLKRNSGFFTPHLDRIRTQGLAVCLELYGIRDMNKSEYMNVIKVNSWTSIKKYEDLSFDERDGECRKHKDDPNTIIVAP
jgi:hypothetical protein